MQEFSHAFETENMAFDRFRQLPGVGMLGFRYAAEDLADGFAFVLTERTIRTVIK